MISLKVSTTEYVYPGEIYNDGTNVGESSTTTREVDSVSYTEDMSFEVGGNFTLEELIKNNSEVYIFYIEKDGMDSFSCRTAEYVDFIQAFLSEEKAELAKKALNIQEAASDLIYKNSYVGLKQEALIHELYKLTQQLSELGINKDLTDIPNLNKGVFLDEKGQVVNIYIHWVGSMENKHSDYIIKKPVLNIPLQIKDSIDHPKDNDLVAAKVIYQEDVSETSQPTSNNRADTYTSRTIEGITFVDDNSYNVAGDFTFKELKQANGVVFLYYRENNSFDSFGCDTNKYLDCVELFITEEKANNAKKAIAIQEEAIRCHHGIKPISYYKNFLDDLSKQLKQLGIHRDLTINTNQNPINIVQYLSETGQHRNIYVSLGEKHNDGIQEFVVQNIPSLNIETNKSLSTNKPKL